MKKVISSDIERNTFLYVYKNLIPGWDLPLLDNSSQFLINIDSGLSAFLRIILASFKHQANKEPAADRKHLFKHAFRKNKMGSMFIKKQIQITVVWKLIQSIFYSSTIAAGIPQTVILCANQTILPLIFSTLIFSSSLRGCRRSDSSNSFLEAIRLPPSFDSSSIFFQYSGCR